MLLHWFGGRAQDSVVIACGDNQPCLGALAKGRSSIWDLNVICRKAAAVCIATGMVPFWLWLASEDNPADGPSRWFRSAAMGWLRNHVQENGEAANPGPRCKSIIYHDDTRRRMSGPLGAAFTSVSGRSAAAYLHAVLLFTTWVREVGDPSVPMGRALADYVHWAFDTEQVSKGDITYLMSALNILRSREKTRGDFVLASRALSGWSRLVPGKSHLPVPRRVLLACCVEISLLGRRHFPLVTALLLGFDCYLRHSELKWLRVSDIAFPGDPRLMVRSLAAVFLFSTKAGRKQWVSIRCALAVACLRRLVARRRPSDFLFGSYASCLLEGFKLAQETLGFHPPRFVMHSLRHGGASYDFLRGHSLDQIVLRGRWSGLPITRRYIQESQALTLEMDIPRSVQRKIEYFVPSDAVVRKWLGLPQ